MIYCFKIILYLVLIPTSLSNQVSSQYLIWVLKQRAKFMILSLTHCFKTVYLDLWTACILESIRELYGNVFHKHSQLIYGSITSFPLLHGQIFVSLMEDVCNWKSKRTSVQMLDQTNNIGMLEYSLKGSYFVLKSRVFQIWVCGPPGALLNVLSQGPQETFIKQKFYWR